MGLVVLAMEGLVTNPGNGRAPSCRWVQAEDRKNDGGVAEVLTGVGRSRIGCRGGWHLLAGLGSVMVNDDGRGPRRCDVGSSFSLTASFPVIPVMAEESSGDHQHEHSHAPNACLSTATPSLH